MGERPEGGMIWRCDLVPQYEAQKEDLHKAIEQVLRSGRYTLGENVAAFEAEFAAYVGCRYGVGLNSGTDALILALSCADLREGDEVVTTPFTAIPTYSAIRRAGARPVFVDIDPRTFLMDVEQVQRAMTSRTKAIVPVHLFGNVVDVERIRRIVGPTVCIIEDCAQSHGASIRGKMSGTMGDLAAFSFYPTKNLGCFGDGGMVLTDNRQFADAVRLRRMYGMINKDEFVLDGINSRLDELQAAILRVRLRRLDELNNHRRRLAERYRALLMDLPVRPQKVADDVSAVYHVYCALCDERRDELVRFLEDRKIQTNVYYPKPLSRQEGYRRVYGDGPELPAAEEVCRRVIALPFYPEMSEGIMTAVAEGIRDFYKARRSRARRRGRKP